MSTAAEATVKPKRRFTRELTSLVGAPFMIWLIGWAPSWLYEVVIAAVAALALFEFLDLGRHKGYPVHRTVSILLMLGLLSAFSLEQVSVELGVVATLLIIPALYVFTARNLEEALPATAVCVLGTLYVGMLAGAMLRLRIDFPVGSKLIFFLLLVVWMGDAGAYYVGSKFGKRRLSPIISPKKSVEGLIGGVFTSLIAAVVIHFTFFPEFPLVHALICAAILSSAGVIGDLAESLWKRSAAVKDSGTLIPGHGGFLDRFDSILFTAPLLYAYWFLLQHDFRVF
jgi:phosphatidate cytidylyltransferase